MPIYILAMIVLITFILYFYNKFTSKDNNEQIKPTGFKTTKYNSPKFNNWIKHHRKNGYFISVDKTFEI